jgi:hypothetical protein
MKRSILSFCMAKTCSTRERTLDLSALVGIVRLNFILCSGDPGPGGASLYLLTNRRPARRDPTSKTAYTDLP